MDSQLLSMNTAIADILFKLTRGDGRGRSENSSISRPNRCSLTSFVLENHFLPQACPCQCGFVHSDPLNFVEGPIC